MAGEQQQQAGRRHELARQKQGNRGTKPHSTQSSALTGRAAAIAPAMARLCSAKQTVNLSQHALQTWAAALSVYHSDIVNFCIVQAAISPDPFPDLGVLMAACKVEHGKRHPQAGRQSDTPSKATVQAVAKAWGINL